MAEVSDEELRPQLDLKAIHEVQVLTKLKVPVELGQDFKHAGLSQLVVIVNSFEDDLDLLLGPKLSIAGGKRVHRLMEPVHESLDNWPIDLSLQLGLLLFGSHACPSLAKKTFEERAVPFIAQLGFVDHCVKFPLDHVALPVFLFIGLPVSQPLLLQLFFESTSFRPFVNINITV